MTNKFNVGDKVVPVSKTVKYFGNLKDSNAWNSAKAKGQPFLFVTNFNEGENIYTCGVQKDCGMDFFKESDLIPFTKVSKNQRITALETEVAELKLIVHRLCESNITIEDIKQHFNIKSPSEDFVAKPPTDNKCIIEFEGEQYKKVDRKACEGDVVVLKGSAQSQYILNGVPYKTFIGRYDCLAIQANGSDHIKLYSDTFKRTPETVDVYELIKEGLNPQIPIADETVELSPNQQRAAIIEKAKTFMESTKKTWNGLALEGSYKGQNHTFENVYRVFLERINPLQTRVAACDVEFIVNEEKRTIVALMRSIELNKIYVRGIAKCNPSDVFNEHIGKAIALGRALGLDVSEFENAVQPTLAVGQITNLGEVYAVKPTHRTFGFDKGYKFSNPGSGYTVNDNGYEHWLPINWAEIINDTNAQYLEVE